MADRPIIFSGPMVRALLAGRKTQTRRLSTSPLRRCAVGDRLYVREAWAVKRFEPCLPHERDWQSLSAPTIRFLADGVEVASEHGDRATGRGIYHGPVEKGRPSIHMPRWASRVRLTVENVHVERLQAIGEAEAEAEGCVKLKATGRAVTAPGDQYLGTTWPSCRAWYADLWDSLHSADGERWEDDPLVVALTFSVARGNIDRLAGAPNV